MLEIIALIFLTKRIGELATKKGLVAAKWKTIQVLLWIGIEILVLLLVLQYGGMDLLIPAAIAGIAAAALTHIPLYNHIKNLPSEEIIEEEDIQDKFEHFR